MTYAYMQVTLGILRELNLTERGARVGCDTACGISRQLIYAHRRRAYCRRAYCRRAYCCALKLDAI